MSARQATAAVAAMLAAGCLTACGLDKPDSGTSTAASAPKRLHVIDYVNPLPNDPLWDRIGQCMKQEGARYGITVHEVGPPGGNVDIQSLENLDSQAVANGTEALATWSAGAPEAFDAIFARARAAGANVVTFISSGSTRHQTVDIGTYPADFAHLQMDYIAKQPGMHHIGVLAQGQSGAGYDDYVRGMKAAVAEHSNVRLSGITYDKGVFSDDVSLVSTMLTAHPEIDTIVNYSGFPGVLTAIKEHHLVGKVRAVISSDFPDAVESDIAQGLVAGVRVVPACHMGRMAVHKLMDAAAGRRVRPHYDEGDRIVDGQEFEHLAATGRL